nr:arsenic transporter [Saccharopolyspora sp. HNM0983]
MAILIFLGTLALVIVRPRGLGIGWSALAGAGVALLTGVVRPGDVPEVVSLVWNATLAFVAIVLISLLLDACGMFEWAALHVARLGRGSGRALFALVILLGAVISAVFANDGAALILTPIVLQMLVALRFPQRAALGFVLATGFIADTGSLPLLVSNLVNIVSADFFGIGFTRYALVMVPVSAVSVLASLGVLFGYFHRDIPARYDPSGLPEPGSAVRDRTTFRVGWVVLAALLVGYFAADPLGVPLSVVAGAGAVVLLAVAAGAPARVPVAAGGAPEREHVAIDVRRVVREAPWQIVLFSIGMYVVVYGLRNQGLTEHLGALLGGVAGHGVLAAALGTGLVVAVLASVMNNLPTVLVVALAIAGTGAGGAVHEAMVYANVIGSDLGPKITPIGSLATLLWLHVLAQRGLHIGWGRYFRTGVVLTLPVLLVTLLALAGWLTVLHG